MSQSNIIGQLAHAELLTAKPEQTLSFFTDLLGMQVTQREGQSVYLRAYQDTYHHSLVVTEAPDAGLGHVAWRANSAAALEEGAAMLEAAGRGEDWIDGDAGHGPAYRFTTPDGHPNELLWEVERYRPTEQERSALASAVQKRPLQGVPVKRIDHINLLTADLPATKAFYVDTLGFKCRERIEMPDGTELGTWLSFSPFPHELAIMADSTGTAGRLHHVAFWYGNDTHLNDCAEALREEGITIEAGPSKHGITQSPFMYVYEPGGNRIELFGENGYFVLEPDWQPRTWTAENLAIGVSMYGLELPPTFFAYGTPTVEITEDAKTDALRHQPTPAQVPIS
jgi:catechol 2,3-dioxygenase